MAKCKNCKNIKWLSDISEAGERGYNWCPIIDDCPDPETERNCGYYDVMTQADRIRSMTDEELALVLMCPNENGLANIDCDHSDKCNCYKCILGWLQSPVEV